MQKEEGRAASESPYKKFGYFLFPSKEFLLISLKNLAVKNFFPKQKEQRQIS
jgi:hypothetical protein